MTKKKNNIAILMLSIALVFVVFLMIPHDGVYTDTRNNNASYHILATVKNLQNYSLDEHYLLPIVTMRNCEATEWGACLKGIDEKFYYCSFMPLDFIIPYFFFSVTGLSLSTGNLYLLSILFCLLSIVYLRKILIEVYGNSENEIGDHLVIILSYVFSYEGIHCATNVFWGELIFQPLMLAIVWCILRYQQIKSKRTAVFIVLGTGIGCALDWSAYTFAVAVIVYYFIDFLRHKDRQYLKIFTAIILSVILFSMLVVMHYSLKVPINQYFAYCIERFFSRSAVTNQSGVTLSFVNSLSLLLRGYWESYGVWIIFVAIAIIIHIKSLKNGVYCNKKLLIVIGIILFTCTENILMMQHAIEYTYDRIKIAPIITCIVFSLYREIEINKKKWFVFAVVIVAFYCLRGYECGIHGYIYNNQNYSENYILADYLKNKMCKNGKAYENTVIGINNYCQVRGYANLLFDCNIKEGMSLEELMQYGDENGYEQCVYILSNYYSYSDKYHILGLLVCDNKQDDISYYYVEGEEVCEKTVKHSGVHAMPFSDRAFTQGVNLTGSTIRLNKSENITKDLAGASYIVNGTERFEIESVTEYDDSYDIKLMGEVPQWTMKKFEFPSELKIE